MTGTLRGKTLDEKKYGPGYRPGITEYAVAPWAGCGVELDNGHRCSSKVAGSIEMYVDDCPPRMDWYTRLLAKLPPNVWTTVKFCEAHFAEVTRRSTLDLWDTPDQWAPWRASPPVLTHPPKVIEKPKLIVAGD